MELEKTGKFHEMCEQELFENEGGAENLIIVGGVIAACESVFNMVSGAFNAGRAFMRDLRYEFWW